MAAVDAEGQVKGRVGFFVEEASGDTFWLFSRYGYS
jgi:hypothetical protein